MVVVAIVVHDRFDNIKEQIRCYNMCETQGAQLVIIHNYDSLEAKDAYQAYCQEVGVLYIPHKNVGYDIARFQDVCRKRLPDFPEYEYLIWLADDALIMRKDFIKQYLDCFKHFKVGVAALEISKAVRTHIRTTGFAIRKEVAEKLQFPADPITTKEQCYFFEHRGGPHIFLDQVIRLGYKAVQVSPVQTACFWDSGFKKYRNREKEHYQLFPRPAQGTAKIAFICPVYNSYPEIISSLINQTHQNWHLFLIHDGPSSMDINSIVNATKDQRISYVETETRRANWGHSYRKEYLEKLKESDFDYIVITNADNHHTPTYCEYLLKGFTNGQVAVYHDQMIHSYLGWGIINCKLQQGYLDCAGVMVRKDVACEIGWRDVEAHSADWLYFNDIIKKYGAKRFGVVKGCLLSHN